MASDKFVNNQKVTDMLQKILQLGNTFIVDINKAVHYASTPDEPILLQHNESKVKKKLYIYDTNIQDPTACILNPLVETTVTTNDQLLFYSGINSIVSQWLMKVMFLIVEECIRLKEDKDANVNPNLASTLTPFISKVDDKLAVELEKIRGAGYKDFFSIYYNRAKKTSEVFVGFEDETGDYQKLFPNGHIRKRSWSILLDIMKFILKVPSDKKIKEVYTCSTEKIDCPKFTTYMDVWIRTWECIYPYMKYISSDAIYDDEVIDALKEHFKNIPIYRECVSWLKQPALSMQSVTAPGGTANTGIPTNTSSVVTAAPEKKEPSWKITNSNIVTIAPPKPQPSWAITSNTFTSGMGYGSNIVTIGTPRRGW